MKALIEHLGLQQEQITTIPPDITAIAIAPGMLNESVTFLLEADSAAYLSAIIAQETENSIELLYLFTGTVDLALRVNLSIDHPEINSISHLNRAASFYEREAREMLGITFVGLDRPENLLLPQDVHTTPLRKNFVKQGDDL